MKVRRLRILAGPNGSGKSSVYSKLKQTKDFHWGIFVNADEMEKLFRENGGLDVRQYGVDDFPWEVFKREYQPFVLLKNGRCGLDNLRYADGRIEVLRTAGVDSYLASFVADFIRRELLETKDNLVFTIETVMSHRSKLDFMCMAKEKGFRIYLYYVATSSPDINIGRVAARVRNGGHNVPANKIRSRYVRSLNNLRDAVRLSDRAYIFDNSTSAYKWIAEYDARTGDLALRADEVPTWVVRYLLQ